MFNKNYFKKNKVYKINGYYYFVMDGGLSYGEDFEPVIEENNGKINLTYRAVDKFQFTDGTYDNIECMDLRDFLIKYSSYRTNFDNPFTRTLKVVRKVMSVNKWLQQEKTINLRLSEKSLNERFDISNNYKVKEK